MGELGHPSIVHFCSSHGERFSLDGERIRRSPGRSANSTVGDFCLLPSEIALSSLYDAPGLTDLRSVEVPTLIALGDQPDPRGSSAEALAEGLPNAQLFLVRGAAHNPWLEQPEEFFAAICRFLAPGAP